MHLSNEAITPVCAALGFGAAGIALGVGWATARARAGPPKSLWALATAGVFAAQALDVPVLPGVRGHLHGGILLALWFGPAWGMLSMSLVLLAQAVLLGDGGVLALGVNFTNMAVIPCLIVWTLWNFAFGKETGAARWTSVPFAAWLSHVIPAASCGLVLGGGEALASMLRTHAAAGLLEAGVTFAAVAVTALIVHPAPRAPIAEGGLS
jgi:cobalt/nickel transport system permease protein